MNDLIKRSDAIEAVWKPQVKPNELIFDALKTAIESEINNVPSVDIDISEYSDKLWKNAYERGKVDEHRWWSEHCANCTDADRPSVDKEYLTKLIQEAVYDGEACAKLLDLVDRPRGEWIRTGRTNVYGGIEVQCSNCGDKVMVQHLEDEWYCRHCGADMGVKGAEDD